MSPTVVSCIDGYSCHATATVVLRIFPDLAPPPPPAALRVSSGRQGHEWSSMAAVSYCGRKETSAALAESGAMGLRGRQHVGHGQVSKSEIGRHR